MEIVRVPKGRIEARLLLTHCGDRIRAVTSVNGPMQSASEIGDFDTVETAERHGIAFAERHRAHVIYIEERT